MTYSIGLDIGASKIQGIVWDGKKVIEAVKIETPRGREQFLDDLYELITVLMDCAGKDNVRSVGIAIAGVVQKSGVMEKSPNAPFLNGINLSRIVREWTKKPVRIMNDAKAVVLYELKQGIGKRYKNIVVVTLGTGVGGGFSLEGNIVRGAHGAAGEVGHMILGQQGKHTKTLETLASVKALKHGPRHMGEALGVGIANLINIIDPEVVIVGGGLASLGKKILAPAERTMRMHILSPSAKETPIVIEPHYEVAGAIGAALLVSSPRN